MISPSDTRREAQREYNRGYYQKNNKCLRQRKTAYMRQWRAEHPERNRATSRRAKAKIRERLLGMYGGHCAVCGFSDARALTLDHVNGNGATERERLGERGVYRRALEHYQPDEYRTLCMNCQFIARTSA